MTFHPKIEIKKILEKEYTRRFLLGYGNLIHCFTLEGKTVIIRPYQM